MVGGTPQLDAQIEQVHSSQEFEPAIQPDELREHDAQAKEYGTRPDGGTGRDAQCRNNTGTAGMAEGCLGEDKNVRARADHSQDVNSKNATEHSGVGMP